MAQLRPEQELAALLRSGRCPEFRGKGLTLLCLCPRRVGVCSWIGPSGLFLQRKEEPRPRGPWGSSSSGGTCNLLGAPKVTPV